LNKGVKEGYPLKRRYFAVTGYRHRHAAYHNKHYDRLIRFINIDDLERP